MMINRWQWLGAGMLLTGSLAGAANAQERIVSPQTYLPAATSPAACCAPRTPLVTFWQRSKARLEKCLGYDEPDPVPAGTFLYQTMPTQIDNGISARMILHDYDFMPGSADLNLRGRDTLPHLASLALRHPYLVVVERTPTNPGLDDLRRQAVLKELARQSIPLPADRVVVGAPLTRGLYGVEANIIYQNLLNQTTSGGSSQGGASTPATGTSTGASGTTGPSSGTATLPRY
jgi:hypothetical protein